MITALEAGALAGASQRPELAALLENAGRFQLVPAYLGQITIELQDLGRLHNMVAAGYHRQRGLGIRRDDALIARLITLESRFWGYVTSDTAPPADGSESADRALRTLYPGNGSTMDFSDDRQLSSTFADLVSLQVDIKAREGQAERMKQTLQQAMGDASYARFETGDVSFKRSHDSAGVDLKRLLADHPDLAQQYAMTKPGSRRFLIRM